LLDEHPGEAIRTAILSTSYRRPLDWSDETVPQARKFLDRIYGALRELSHVTVDETAPPPSEVLEALTDDLNTPLALSHLATWAGEANKASDPAEQVRLKSSILGGGRLLGVAQHDPDAWFATAGAAAALSAEAIEALIVERAEARKNRDFARADEIRDELASQGVVLEDKSGETRWRRE
ncbi:MAG: DALR domain-containing protein, partial [Myxococcota bacterium]